MPNIPSWLRRGRKIGLDSRNSGSREDTDVHQHSSLIPCYDVPMKTKPQSPEYKAFENLLGSVLSVSKTELNRRIAEEKRTPKAPAPAFLASQPSVPDRYFSHLAGQFA